MKRIALAALFTAGLTAGLAHAQAPDIATGRAPGGGLVVGGGIASLAGSGDDMRITYATGGGGGTAVVREQPGRNATFAGSDGDGRPRFTAMTPFTAPGSGREAWLSGSGDDARLSYGR
jgi:hypothetical protein